MKSDRLFKGSLAALATSFALLGWSFWLLGSSTLGWLRSGRWEAPSVAEAIGTFPPTTWKGVQRISDGIAAAPAYAALLVAGGLTFYLALRLWDADARSFRPGVATQD